MLCQLAAILGGAYLWRRHEKKKRQRRATAQAGGYYEPYNNNNHGYGYSQPPPYREGSGYKGGYNNRGYDDVGYAPRGGYEVGNEYGGYAPSPGSRKGEKGYGY